jgi:AAA family ATP:ADP antiporter
MTSRPGATRLLATALVAIACLALATRPALAPLAAVMVLHRAGDYALLRPGREMLFTAAGRAARYKAKNVVDTVVYRGGDASGAWLVAGMRAGGLELAGVAAAAAVLALMWAATGYAIGRMYERNDHDVGWTDLTSRGAAPACRGGRRALL